MKNLVSILILLASLSGYSQKRVIDKGGGDYYSQGLAVEIIGLIEQNKVDVVLKKVGAEVISDTDNFKKEVAALVSYHVYDEYASPVSFNDNESDSTWYLRTYYNVKHDSVQYNYQIYVKLATPEQSDAYVTDLVIRSGNEVHEIQKEIDHMDKVNSNPGEIPPPPPGPPVPPPPPTLRR